MKKYQSKPSPVTSEHFDYLLSSLPLCVKLISISGVLFDLPHLSHSDPGCKYFLD